MISVIIPVRNNLDLTAKCIASVLEHSPVVELIIVDNASGEDVQGYLETLETLYENVHVIRNAFNFGFPIAVNQGLSVCNGEFIVLLNNDTEVPEDWLVGLLAPFDDPDVGMTGPRGTNISGPQNVEGTWKPSEGWETDRLVGFCLALRREVVDVLGGLDPRFGLGNFDDDDYCLRARLAGFRLRVAGDVLIKHVGHATFDQEQVDLNGLLRVNAKRFLQKWRMLDVQGTSLPEMIASGAGKVSAKDLRIPLNKTHPTVSLCLIAKNEEEFLGDCLKSVQGAVDEIVVIDTGSIDRTVEIAESFGAKIGYSPWDYDFSKPRNAALDLASGDWILVLDADERLKPDSIAEVRWLSHNPLEFGAICQVESEGAKKVVSPVVRFFRNHIGVRYEGRLHEQPLIPGVATALDMSAIRISHLGYEPDVIVARQKLERNLHLAELQHSEGETFHSVFNLTRCHWELEHYATAETFAAQAKSLAQMPADVIHAGVMEIAAAGSRDSDAALGLAIELHDRFPGIPRVAFIVGKILAHQGRHEEAMEALDWRLSEALKTYLSCNFNPADMSAPGTNLREACDLYTVCAVKTHQPSKAVRYLSDAIAVIPVPDFALYLKLARLLAGCLAWQMAGEILNQGLKIEPQNVEGWKFMAEICEALEKPDLVESANRNAELIAV